jgi:hypothetical protein
MPQIRTMAALALAALAVSSSAGFGDYPAFNDVAKDYREVQTTMDEGKFYRVWVREKDGQMLAELPRGYQNQKHYFAMAQPAGDRFAGLQSGTLYVYWKQFDNRLALIRPNIAVRTSGDQESKASVEQIFTDRVLLDVPIVCMGPSGQPVIDMDDLLVKRGETFYGRSLSGINPRLAKVVFAKVFPENIELEFEAPVAGGTIKSFHYSISNAPQRNGYKPREADPRIGYFMTSYRDLGKFSDEDVWVRYINRWRLEKADPKLSMSPPREPIIFYLHHTVPVRYRRWVRDGILEWNKAFEAIGIDNAIEVRIQDARTGAHMEKDAEDVRYNFILWLSNDIGTAIGPSRVDPMTGQILDADVILTDGWIRHFWYQANELLPQIATESMSEETLEWLRDHPQWDPRVRLAPANEQDEIIRQIAAGTYDTLAADIEDHRHCSASKCLAMDMSMMSLHLATMDASLLMGEEGDMLDGIPEAFIGPMLKILTTHEVGHTLGLRHNFKASSIYSFAEINSEENMDRPFAGSVMDYNPVNINMDDELVQGPFANLGIGPYDMWAIEYGYGFGNPEEVLKRVAEPELIYGSDEDTSGPDPLARAYDFTSEPLDYAENLMKLARHHRERILSDFVEDGDAWSKARRGYGITLSTQTNALSIMTNWIGGAFVYRDKKGDPDGRIPLEPVPADQQRAALEFVIENSFHDEAFGLSPELIQHLTIGKWTSGGDATWPVHDAIAGIQASIMTQIMNPTTLRRVYDNEMMVPSDEDALTIPEMLATVRGAVWSELDWEIDGPYTDRKPMISSLRRNLQREYLDRMISMATGNVWGNASGKTISGLMLVELETLKGSIAEVLEADIDRYTHAHLVEAMHRIEQALEAGYMRRM